MLTPWLLMKPSLTTSTQPFGTGELLASFDGGDSWKKLPVKVAPAGEIFAFSDLKSVHLVDSGFYARRSSFEPHCRKEGG